MGDMSLETLESPNPTSSDYSDLDHWYCIYCSPDGSVALCSTDLRDATECDLEEPSCVVCLELGNLPACPKCGDVW